MKTLYSNCRKVLCIMGLAATVSVTMVPVSLADGIMPKGYRERQRHIFRDVQRGVTHPADQPPAAATPTKSRPLDILCSHSNEAEHQRSCFKTRSDCYDQNRRVRPHEITHCNIRFDQCMRLWN